VPEDYLHMPFTSKQAGHHRSDSDITMRIIYSLHVLQTLDKQEIWLYTVCLV